MTRLAILSAAFAALALPATAATYNEAATFADNAAAEALWLGTAGIASPEYLLNFETGYTDGQTVSGAIGYGGLSIAGIGQGGGDPTIESGTGNIGGSNPIGSYALELADDGSYGGMTVLSLTFESALAYLSFYMIDASTHTVNYGAGSVNTGATGSSGETAEFRGFVFAPSETVTTIDVLYDSSGASGWAIDNIAWGYKAAVVPLPATLPLLLLGLGGTFLMRRRQI
ncbi:PEP-CTERM sorting domain-containing protein [Pacificoceanicola onchidii]|uniref:PEP-CTERM sorting domain-containing protein n=1 Tax=Pacificoceanicola onchidii TaxID=2562685 RepID=UPI0010A5DA23|nr:PEP-CTERM sorting domain-containing protein [Pacificoceanicola onchidii]